MSERSYLEEINIRGLGVIEQATLEFSPGLTIFSGETGAGKTMVLTALNLALGRKVEALLIRQGSERMIASASFRIPSQIEDIAIERGASVEENVLILSRSMGLDARSRAQAGGLSVPSAVLNELGELLVEIHGQAASTSLGKVSKQREILDRYADKDCDEKIEAYRSALDSFTALKAKIESLRKNSLTREREVAVLREFADAFTKVQPILGESSSLLAEITRLSSVESLQRGVGEAAKLLDEEDLGVLAGLASAKRALEGLQEKDPLIRDLLDSLSESYFQLSESSHAANKYLFDLEMDPQRLEAAQLRKSEITSLLKRYADPEEPDVQIEKLIERFAEVAERIEDLTGGDERLDEMTAQLEGLFQQLVKKAQELSEVRRKFAVDLSSKVTKEIQSLSMPHTSFLTTVASPDYSSTVSFNSFTASGCDDVSMTIQAVKDGPQVPIAKGASGGEMSRVMLALEVVLAQSQPVGTYIFDEVDAGVGGKAAIEVGRRLYELSKSAQVLVVTHLPQVAAWADSHFVVRKNDEGAVNQSTVLEISGDARIEEIARMLAGHEDSRSAREHATELLAMRESHVKPASK